MSVLFNVDKANHWLLTLVASPLLAVALVLLLAFVLVGSVAVMIGRRPIFDALYWSVKRVSL
ncbi:hypothetical protein AB0H71_28970 [Nocardia sp. NPDC050697]|uniref:hypothetical protein n=1 Tax=Nocardia sp. NPDC050697 TaxID=3155158 RepID=UPI0033DF9BCF